MNELTVATWNLDYGRGITARSFLNRLHLRDAMQAVDADIWVLTESHTDLQPAPGYVRVAMSAQADDRPENGRWVAIWARDGVDVDSVALNGGPEHFEQERSAAVLLRRTFAQPLLIFGTVLPWRNDGRRPGLRGGAAFVQALGLQASEWSRLSAEYSNAALCIAGDFNQEYGANGRAGTSAGRRALDDTLKRLSLTCVTGEPSDPRLARGWPRSIDHILLDRRLRAVGEVPRLWPEQHPHPKGWPDHHGVAVTITEAHHG